jgi:hypothetical protein
MTVPFGKKALTSHYRIYEGEVLDALLRGYFIDCDEYYHLVGHSVCLPARADKLAGKERGAEDSWLSMQRLESHSASKLRIFCR